jgi:hypothetical protein
VEWIHGHTGRMENSFACFHDFTVNKGRALRIRSIFGYEVLEELKSIMAIKLLSWVRFPVLPDFLNSSGSGTGSNQTLEDK